MRGLKDWLKPVRSAFAAELAASPIGTVVAPAIPAATLIAVGIVIVVVMAGRCAGTLAQQDGRCCGGGDADADIAVAIAALVVVALMTLMAPLSLRFALVSPTLGKRLRRGNTKRCCNADG